MGEGWQMAGSLAIAKVGGSVFWREISREPAGASVVHPPENIQGGR